MYKLINDKENRFLMQYLNSPQFMFEVAESW